MMRSHSRSALDALLERKVGLSRRVLFLEAMWPRVWLVLALLGLFLAVSLAGLWPLLTPAVHKVVLSAFGLALLGATVFVLRTPWPSREEALRRLEVHSGLPHRPASSYSDTLTGQTSDPATSMLWQTHRSRLSRLIGRLSPGAPRPRTDRHDPFAVRALLTLAVVLLLGLVGESARDRLQSAFRFASPINLAEVRLDAWVTPPAYTSKPPILLIDGQRPLSEQIGSSDPYTVPAGSLLIGRMSGTGVGKLTFKVTPPEAAVAPEPQTGAAKGTDSNQASEARLTLKGSGEVRVLTDGSQVALWKFDVVPDKAPTIALVKDPELSRRGSMKLTYKMSDDYSVASAEAVFERIEDDGADPRTRWAREDLLKGPRLALERPPRLALRLPRSASAKDGDLTSNHELGAHPLAGLRVRMTLLAKDHAGNEGRSATIEIELPARMFRKPLARAVIEQRRKLALDSRYRPHVAIALDALTIEPDKHITDKAVYLGLRSVYHRLQREDTRAAIATSVEQLWHLAQRIEDGGSLSDAQRRLRDLQERLSKALQEGASDEELQRLMQELRQALNEFMEQLARQAQNMPPMQMPDGLNQNQIMRSEDLDRMLRDLENMMRQGSREQAQDMLSQLRDLLDQLQSGQMAQMGQQGQQMMQMMDQLGDLVGRQQRLMDDTFGAQRQDGQQGQQGQQGQRGQGQQGQQGQGQQGQGQGQGRGELGQRQGQLRGRLGQLQRQLGEFGMRAPSQFDGAGQAMENAERALEQGDLETATREQGRALEQLRQGAQSMAEQMLRQMPSRFGRAMDAPLDPLGRPQRTEGPDLGTSVKVPDEIDVQRAREILEELRRRLGETTRPTLELDYLERLLRRF